LSTNIGGMTHHLVGLTEIAGMFGVSRQYIDRLVRQDGFPAPEAVISAGRIWSREAIEEWARETGREIVGEG
jgi:predicted DNA-binding transcriptional regulator AlpA